MQEADLTTPEQAGEGQNPQDLINASLIFARALGLILKNGEGIVVDVVGDINLGPEIKKVIVFEYNDQVHIYKCEEDLEEGTAVNMDTNNKGPEVTEPSAEPETEA
jgi:hypothetical protein